ncbi:DUF2905 domain-containing protein [Jiella marina]|uniref:DUF2905 domain-containing protein n=1 Tax=Jiella sp. LLJ827 TaxID=2917712 RepID=UPI0021019692|nr:DUF2905 domain-containing protein [Jiella sp. LLJ827]MCQ0989451.1 DUF2905 domain-containing protein [Jiella sp. LLJ827]
MSKTLIILGLVIVAIGLAWPWIGRLGLGQLPGDIIIRRGETTFYLPIVTCLVLSIVASIVLWLFGR